MRSAAGPRVSIAIRCALWRSAPYYIVRAAAVGNRRAAGAVPVGTVATVNELVSSSRPPRNPGILSPAAALVDERLHRVAGIGVTAGGDLARSTTKHAGASPALAGAGFVRAGQMTELRSANGRGVAAGVPGPVRSLAVVVRDEMRRPDVGNGLDARRRSRPRRPAEDGRDVGRPRRRLEPRVVPSARSARGCKTAARGAGAGSGFKTS